MAKQRSARFTKMSNGKWGVAVDGSTEPGTCYHVRKTSGGTSEITIEAVAGRTPDGMTICSFVDPSRATAAVVMDIVTPAQIGAELAARHGDRAVSASTARAAQAAFNRDYDPTDMDDQMSGMRPSRNWRSR